MEFPRLAIVDLETTGADPNRDSITEIAILITEGDQLVTQWSSLVNPQRPIPERIQELIGITDAMVATAPSFAELADEVRARLADTLFVAHNARFDYGFLRSAFERLGQSWDAPVLCTVKLSRALNPQFPRHGLDALIERGGYAIDARHRALDDAQIVWRFLQDARRAHDAEVLTRAWQRAGSTTRTPRLPTGDLEAMTEGPGAYVLYGAAGQVLELGRTRNLRAQLLGMFTGQRNDTKTKRLAAQVKDVESFPAAGELDAQLQELRLQRLHNWRLKDEQAWAWMWLPQALKAPVLRLQNLADSDPATWEQAYGYFRGEREAKAALAALARPHKLCSERIGLSFGGGVCMGASMGGCKGVCSGREPAAQHDARMAAALASLKQHTWPFAGAIEIREAHGELTAVHRFEHWCHLGSARSEEELHALREQRPERRLDVAVFRILQRWLERPDARAGLSSTAL